MVYGIGTDIVEIDRIANSINKFGDKFLNKIFTELEREYCLSKKNSAQHFAARFAAKEAVFKALASQYSEIYSWQDIEVYNEPSGLPKVKLYGELANVVSIDKSLQISMSHSKNYATCFAILFKNC